MTVPSSLENLRVQYEALPYPPRDPREEQVRLITGTPSHILEINHYLFAGRLNLNRPFRALIAGGGTGDACIMLAQQLVDRRCPAEVVYLDLSSASRKVCEARAKARGLRNINFITGSLLDLPAMNIGTFDYIDCTGVLHHLPDPTAGMQALASVLEPEGGIGVMLYGQYGRTGVYPLQEMLRTLAPPSMAIEDRIAMAKRLIRFLPTTNLFRRNPYLNDHVTGGDAGLYDLLLHSCDRAYTVPEIGKLAGDAGLRVVAFLEPVRYEPSTYMSDPVIARQASSLPLLERAAFAERLAGNLRTHVFYATRAGYDTVARPEDTQAIPVLREMDPHKLAAGLQPGQPLIANLDGFPWRAQLPPLAPRIISLIDGRRSVAELYTALGAQGGLPQWEDFYAQFEDLYVKLNGVNHLLLRFRT
ncbi:Methyltransferase domain-containing protein [Enhydrobacter aerosaccus]|uniref:Methyltransferase domain-containing protein n=1 Tax=Enhydrobacter aerosaccus TaxID=225324 RepID=A0A1T4QAC5_9HYPH|nr:class I SAM-dependent methyltransferase [Enhydrobacter aerosaccus]SKA00634.1 Methyltransferase domain-containing protein [Enhydrobacter aerosaccus]